MVVKRLSIVLEYHPTASIDERRRSRAESNWRVHA